MERIKIIRRIQANYEASGKTATLEDIAAELNMEAAKVDELLTLSRDVVSMDLPVGEEEDSTLGDFIPDKNTYNPEDSTLQNDLLESLEKAMTCLSAREKNIIIERFGLYGKKAKTLEEIGTEMGVTRERVRQIEMKALRKLKNPKRSIYLRSYPASIRERVSILTAGRITRYCNRIVFSAGFLTQKEEFHMKRKHILTIALCLSALSAMPAYAAGWVQENGEWYYEDNYGDYVTDTWRSSGNGEYYLGDDGRMVTSALIDTGSALYYVDSSGRRVENSWRQLMDDDGELAWYYFQSSGKAKEEGYLTIEGTRYHFTDYKLDTGWTEGDDGDYYFDADTYQPGWHYVEEFGDNDLEPGWYYTKSNGEVVKGEERKINGYYYAFNDNGLMCDGWVEFTEDGETICKYYRLGNGDRMDGLDLA